ncbi:hypothetical protein, partial [Escherichia coli]|uniref:hypothetical protein n=1 Tax=Escherichia coli TaxID=562 RepID=UPI002ACC002E
FPGGAKLLLPSGSSGISPQWTFPTGTLTTSRGSCLGADAKVFDACGKKFCGWYISPLDD